jgi:hypothetical protein
MIICQVGMANIFAGTAQYLPAWLNISRHSTIFASMANILAGTAHSHAGKY